MMLELHYPITITKSHTNNNLWFLREDLLPVACGGNKVRIASLSFFMMLWLN